MNVIDRFDDQEGDGGHAPWSNFYHSPFRAPWWRGRVPHEWPTVEHYYQAAKTADPIEAREIQGAASPGQAKRLGRRCSIYDAWEAEKIVVMRLGLSHKFAPGTELAQMLLGTGDAMMIEGNTWGDRFWGCVKKAGVWDGQNWLGWLLMAQRAYLRTELWPKSQ